MSNFEIIVVSALAWIVSFVRGPEGQAIEDYLTEILANLENPAAPGGTTAPPSGAAPSAASTAEPSLVRGLRAKTSSVPTE